LIADEHKTSPRYKEVPQLYEKNKTIQRMATDYKRFEEVAKDIERDERKDDFKDEYTLTDDKSLYEFISSIDQSKSANNDDPKELSPVALIKALSKLELFQGFDCSTLYNTKAIEGITLITQGIYDATYFKNSSIREWYHIVDKPNSTIELVPVSMNTYHMYNNLIVPNFANLSRYK